MDAADWNDRYAASELVWSTAPNQFVVEHCAGLTPGTALDLGAGEGRNALWLAQRGWRVTAVDFAQVGLDTGRRLAAAADPPVGPDAIDWVCADATTYRPDRPQDLVVVAYLQLAAPERAVAVRNAFDALAPGGTLLWVAHDSTNLTEGTGGPQRPEVLMTAEDLLADLARPPARGFAVVHAGRVARVVGAGPAEHGHGDDPARTAWDCVLRVSV